MTRPLRNNVWLLFPPAQRDVGGVVLAPEDPSAWMDAVIVAAGPGVPESLGIGVGDTVVANLYDGMPVEHEGGIYRCVPSSKLLAVLEG